MFTDNKTLMQMARECLRGQWGLAIGTFLLYSLFMGSFGAMRELGIITLIIGGPIELGVSIFSLSIARKENARIEQLFEGFNNFATALVTYLLIILYVFIGLIILIVPGIIAALQYSMSFYILADHPELKAQEVMQQSKEMMEGHKMKLLYLGLRFFLLALLCILTLGIGFLWLVPYFHVTMAKFYEDVAGIETNASQMYQENEIV